MSQAKKKNWKKIYINKYGTIPKVGLCLVILFDGKRDMRVGRFVLFQVSKKPVGGHKAQIAVQRSYQYHQSFIHSCHLYYQSWTLNTKLDIPCSVAREKKCGHTFYLVAYMRAANAQEALCFLSSESRVRFPKREGPDIHCSSRVLVAHSLTQFRPPPS